MINSKFRKFRKISKKSRENSELPTQFLRRKMLFQKNDKKREREKFTKNSSFIPFNGLPMTGPQMLSNIMKCKFFEKGKCIYGSQCKYSHIFRDNLQMKELTYATNLTDSFLLKDLKLEVKTSNLSSLRKEIKRLVIFELSNEEYVIIFIADEKSIYICDAKNYKISAKINCFQITDFCPLLLNCGNSHKRDLHIAIYNHFDGRIKILNFQTKKIVKQFFTSNYSFQSTLTSVNSNHTKNSMMNQSNVIFLKKRSNEKLKPYLILSDPNGGTFRSYDCYSSQLLKYIITGYSFSDFILSEHSYEKEIQKKELFPSSTSFKSIFLAGKGIHIWDIARNKKIKTLSYNQYAKYVKIIEFENSLSNENSSDAKQLVIGLGYLHDAVIGFTYDMFIEIWNPISGGCLRRINNTLVEKNFPDAYVKLFLIPIKEKNILENKWGLMLVSPENIQIRDLKEEESILWMNKGNYFVPSFYWFNIERNSEIRILDSQKKSFKCFY